MILPRQYGYGSSSSRNCNYYGNCRRSAWSRFGRWVLAGILIFIAIFMLLVLLCMRNRRRRRAHPKINSNPMTHQTHAPAPQTGTYYNQDQGYAQNQSYNQGYAPPPGAPPKYGGGGYGNEYGQQQTGVEMPGNTYQPGRY